MYRIPVVERVPPELQPAKPLWPLVRETLANKTFPTLAALTEPLERRCRWLAVDTTTVKGAVGFQWAVALERLRISATWYHPRVSDRPFAS